MYNLFQIKNPKHYIVPKLIHNIVNYFFNHDSQGCSMHVQFLLHPSMSIYCFYVGLIIFTKCAILVMDPLTPITDNVTL